MSNVIKITKENYEQEVLNSDKPVVLDFWAEWCGPCKAFSPIFEKVAGENSDVVFAKVNVEEEKELAAQFGVRGIPFIAIVEKDEQLGAKVGAMGEVAFRAWLESMVE